MKKSASKKNTSKENKGIILKEDIFKKGALKKTGEDLEKYRLHLEKYRLLLDETIKNLIKMYELKRSKPKPVLSALGISLLSIGGVVIAYSASIGFAGNGSVTFWGPVGIFIGLSLAFLGYIIAHKGLKGTWL